MSLFRSILGRFGFDRSGNVIITTAILMPVMVVGAFGGVSVTQALTKRQELRDLVELACSRAVKPTRMKILADADRTAEAKKFFASAASDRGLTVTAFELTSNWLSATVTASASVPALENVALTTKTYNFTASTSCKGLPPYPAVGDTILSSDFTRPDGTKLPMKYGTWGIYKATEFGWEGGGGPGVEIQDWKNPSTYGTLPPGSTSRYVVELDSDYGPSWNRGNSSMYRTLELHKGTYRFSFWYFGREEDAESNRISVYLEGTRPVSAKIQKLTIARPRSAGWIYAEFKISIDTYSLYRLTLVAEGTDNGQGGNFNNLKLEYIGRPGEHV